MSADDVLVIGGSGFLGRHVVPHLVSRGHRVAALARSQQAAETVVRCGATPLPGDLDDPASLDAAFARAGVDTLVNLASLGFGHAPAIISAALDADVRRAVFVSSTAIFTTIDAPSVPRRRAGEDAVTASPLEWTVVRPTMIYGAPGDRNLERLLRLLVRSPLVPLPGGGQRLQQPVHVDDLARTIVELIDRPHSIHRCYDLAGPEPITFRALIEQAAAAVSRHPRLVPLPLRPAITAARLYEQVARRPRIKAEQLERLAEDKAFDIAPAVRDLDYRPRAFADGIADEARALGLA